MPYIGQSDPSGNYRWDGSGWVVGPNVDIGYGLGVSPPNVNDLANYNVQQAYNPGLYVTNSGPGSLPANPPAQTVASTNKIQIKVRPGVSGAGVANYLGGTAAFLGNDLWEITYPVASESKVASIASNPDVLSYVNSAGQTIQAGNGQLPVSTAPSGPAPGAVPTNTPPVQQPSSPPLRTPGATVPPANTGPDGNTSIGPMPGEGLPPPQGTPPDSPFTDQNGLSIGAQVLQAVASLGHPPSDAEAVAIWKRAGLTDAQANTIHQYIKNWQMTAGKTVTEGQVNDALGQVKAGQAPDASKWRDPTGASSGGGGGAPGATPGGGTSGTTPPVQSVGGDNTTNPFLKNLRMADLLDTVRRDKGDLSNASETMVSNYEGQNGGRFNAANRDMFGQAADDMKGLFTLESVVNPSFTDTPSRLADYYQQRINGGGPTQYDQSQMDLLRRAVSSLEGGADDATRSAFISDPTAQAQALRTALQRSVNPVLASTVGQRVNELAARYNTVDTTRGPSKTGFLGFARSNGLF